MEHTPILFTHGIRSFVFMSFLLFEMFLAVRSTTPTKKGAPTALGPSPCYTAENLLYTTPKIIEKGSRSVELRRMQVSHRFFIPMLY